MVKLSIPIEASAIIRFIYIYLFIKTLLERNKNNSLSESEKSV